MKMKVLIADKFPDLYVKKLEEAGIDVIYNPKLGENDLPEAAKEVD
jgi:D-3-phosphoglycerate dehydrogenase